MVPKLSWKLLTLHRKHKIDCLRQGVVEIICDMKDQTLDNYLESDEDVLWIKADILVDCLEQRWNYLI